MAELCLILGLITASIILDRNVRLKHRVLSGLCFVLVLCALMGSVR